MENTKEYYNGRSHNTVYRYVGETGGLHEFTDGEKRELFARRSSAPASWHLRHGAYFYEFVRSI